MATPEQYFISFSVDTTPKNAFVLTALINTCIFCCPFFYLYIEQQNPFVLLINWSDLAHRPASSTCNITVNCITVFLRNQCENQRKLSSPDYCARKSPPAPMAPVSIICGDPLAPGLSQHHGRHNDNPKSEFPFPSFSPQIAGKSHHCFTREQQV